MCDKVTLENIKLLEVLNKIFFIFFLNHRVFIYYHINYWRLKLALQVKDNTYY